MTSYNIKSTVISNRDAVPKVLTDAYVSGGEIKESEGFIQTHGSADAAGSIYRLCMVPSNARLSSLSLQAGALGSGAALDIGVYYPTFIPAGAGLLQSNAGLVINTQLFCSALGCSAATAETNVINSSANNTIPLQEKALWDAAGLASDPGIDLDICASVQTAIAAQAYIGLKARYCK